VGKAKQSWGTRIAALGLREINLAVSLKKEISKGERSLLLQRQRAAIHEHGRKKIKKAKLAGAGENPPRLEASLKRKPL